MILIDMGAIEKKENTALEIYNTKPGTKAIEVRRIMVQLPEVAKALNPVEKYVFAASTKTPIAEIDDAKLVENLSLLFKRIAIDVGYIIPQNENDWDYIQYRLLDILKRYYSDMTLADIKMAFELATTGELDEYLPKDKQGNPDKNHYQQFNADYFAKILKAYKQKQTDVIDKAYKYTAFQVRRKGTESPEIDFTAFEVARKKEIIKAFDRMIAEEMQVDNYMKF